MSSLLTTGRSAFPAAVQLDLIFGDFAFTLSKHPRTPNFRVPVELPAKRNLSQKWSSVRIGDNSLGMDQEEVAGHVRTEGCMCRYWSLEYACKTRSN